jgi:2,3-bisphosphoglycerate-independent phosphoglycerate mutase
MPAKRPLVLMILDGFGYREDTQYNAIAEAHTSQWDSWWKTKPHILLDASSQAVGLPAGQMGNSEVGHMHIGAGRIILQDLTRINQSIQNGDFFQNQILLRALSEAQRDGKTIHILGLCSDGGVHSHETHLFAFLKLCQQQQFTKVALHLFLDGRDTPPQSFQDSLNRINTCLEENPVGHIVSLCGRFYAMDRDKRWDRVEPFYRLLTENQSEYQFDSAEQALSAFYQDNITDEFIPPTRIGLGQAITDGDSVFFFNFRADRTRQLTQALLLPTFNDFHRMTFPRISHCISMTRYAKTLPTEVAFPPLIPHNTLGEVVAHQGMTQLRIAETEKYAHVTFFLNGGVENCFPGEDRILIQSPLVKTYDLQPEMSAPELTKRLVQAIQSRAYDLIICNYANADMVGHSGNFNACVTAIEQLDLAMQETWQALEKVGGHMLITADHGNAECMYNSDNQQAHTAHTTSPVPLLYIGDHCHFEVTQGSLIDIAPTVLMLLGMQAPPEMSGHILLVKDDETRDV